MKKITLKKLTLQNFGNTKERTVEFGKRTQIKGRNESGKTTLGDAYSWVLTNKLMNGNQADGIRPRENGKDIDFVDIVATAVLDVDGATKEIQKTQSQEWVKKTGQFKGNNNTYMVNGIPKKEKEFSAFLSEIIPTEAFQFCTSSAALLKLDAKKRRQKIFELIPEFSDEDVIATDAKFGTVRAMLQDGTIDELIARVKFQLNGRGRGDKGLKGQLDDIPTRIDEASKQICDVADLEFAIRDLERQIAEVDKQETDLEQSVKAYDDLSVEIWELKRKREEIISSANSGLREKRGQINTNISDLDIKNKGLSNDLRMAEMDLRHAEMGMQRHESELKKAKEDYKTCSGREFDETKLLAIQSEQFDENSLVCPECGQVRPTEQQENLRETFEKSKERRIKEQEKAREAFDTETERLLDEISERGNKAQQDLKFAKNAEKEAKQKIEKIKREILFVSVEIEQLSGELAKLPQEVDLSDNEEYQKITAQIAEKENALAALDNGSDKRRKIRDKRNALISEKSTYQQKIQSSNDAQARVDDLQEQRREISQRIADCEKELDLLQDFNRAKCNLLTEKVNKLFKFTEWQLFKQQVNGELAEICEPSFKGISYDRRLNDGARALIDADICSTFQRAYGVSLPVWVDNSERMTRETIYMLDDLDCQIIFLKAEECDLAVTQL